MADEERKCLLAEDEDAPQWDRSSGDRGSKGHTPRQIINSLYESDQVLGRHSPFRGDASSSAANEGGVINISASHSPVQFHRSSDSDRIVAVFVVAFDTKAGNVIEWRSPEDVDLDGIEFKALTSGSHTMKTDFVYFRKGNLFGLACFENMPVDNMVERGARMKSVGILATSYTLLYRHMQFLESQVRFMIRYVESVTCLDISRSERHQLETPGRYEQLKAFWEDKKGIICGGRTSLASTPTEYITSELKITHPSKCFSQFLQFFGHQVLTLWKFALLGKRILFFSPPPIGVVCYRVYCTCCLANHSMHRMLSNSDVKPYFYINVADIDEIESEVSYIACTTEKIFEMKPHLYDVYVDNQNVTTSSETLRELLKISDADRDKFSKLKNQRNQQQFLHEQMGDDSFDEEDMFTSFFTEQNNRLIQTLIDVSTSQDRQLTSDHMKSMGLDPIGDRSFLMELVETYGIDVMLMVDNPCCPT